MGGSGADRVGPTEGADGERARTGLSGTVCAGSVAGFRRRHLGCPARVRTVDRSFARAGGPGAPRHRRCMRCDTRWVGRCHPARVHHLRRPVAAPVSKRSLSAQPVGGLRAVGQFDRRGVPVPLQGQVPASGCGHVDDGGVDLAGVGARREGEARGGAAGQGPCRSRQSRPLQHHGRCSMRRRRPAPLLVFKEARARQRAPRASRRAETSSRPESRTHRIPDEPHRRSRDGLRQRSGSGSPDASTGSADARSADGEPDAAPGIQRGRGPIGGRIESAIRCSPNRLCAVDASRRRGRRLASRHSRRGSSTRAVFRGHHPRRSRE